QVQLQQGKNDEARQLFERALKLDPSARKAHYLFGTALQRLSQTNLASVELCLGEGAQDTPMSDPWAEQASAHMKNVTDQIDMAREMREHGEAERAVAVLVAALKYNSTNAALLNNLAITYNQLNRPDLALPVLKRALGQNPRDLTLRISLSYTQQLL